MTDTNGTCSYLITGANSFLGMSLANNLSKGNGNKIFTTSRGTRGEEVISSDSTQQHLLNVDLLQPEDVSRLANHIQQWADGPFHIINCVGYFPGYKCISEVSLDEARKVFESNVLTLYSTARALLPVMASKGGGHFIAFSSHAVNQSYPLMASFTAAKAAVDSLVQSIANEYAKHKITANALAIATIDSPQERSMRPKSNSSDWLHVDQVAQLVEQIVQQPFGVMNGNTIHLYNYSDSYFHQSFYERLGINGASKGNSSESQDKTE